MDGSGFSDEHTAGRPGCPKILQRRSSLNCTHRTPAGLLMPSTTGMPGIGDEIDGAMQQAPQPGRQSWEVERSDISTLFAAHTTFRAFLVSPARDGKRSTA